MSAGGGEVRKVTLEEVQKVQNLIEFCITKYMKKSEVIDVLYQEQNIEPTFTKMVWESLEEQNPEFFEAYLLSLILNDQIARFNNLLDRQDAVTHQVNGVVSNGSHIPKIHNYNASSCYAPENNGDIAINYKAENMQQSFPGGGGYNINNGGPAAYIPSPSDMQHGPLNRVAVNGNGNSKFVHEANGGVLESHPAFGIMDSIPHDEYANHQFIMDDTRSSLLLRQLPHDISPPYPTTPDFTNNTTDTPRFEPNYLPRVNDKSTKYGFQEFSRDS